MPMSLSERFHRTLDQHVAASRTALTPSVLCAAAAETLAVDGAGISLTGEALRLPLGASSPEVNAAEELQTTLGDGPCLAAARSQQPYTADESELMRRWPLYYRGLVDRTTYRSVAAVPLIGPGGAVGAMDLYSRKTSPAGLPPMAEVQSDVMEPALALLLGILDDLHGLGAASATGGGSGLDRSRIRRRIEVWTAVGMIMEAAGAGDLDSLALLRGYAVREGQSLDLVAERLTARDLSSAAVVEADT